MTRSNLLNVSHCGHKRACILWSRAFHSRITNTTTRNVVNANRACSAVYDWLCTMHGDRGATQTHSLNSQSHVRHATDTAPYTHFNGSPHYQ